MIVLTEWLIKQLIEEEISLIFDDLKYKACGINDVVEVHTCFR